MIALDTNVLVRYVVRDDERQAGAARALLDTLTDTEPGFVCREMLVELVWVLARTYSFAAPEIARLLLELLATNGLVLEAEDDVAKAAVAYGEQAGDFSDLMILAAARRSGALPVYTFDQRASRNDGVELIDPETS